MDNDGNILVRSGTEVRTLVPDRPAGITPAVVLINPKTPDNLGSILRTCSCYGVPQIWYTGNRIDLRIPKVVRRVRTTSTNKYRLPREERMKGYAKCQIYQYERPFDMFVDAVPVAVELVAGTQSLHSFEHPINAIYIFGPEDGSLNSMVLGQCHHFVSIPTQHCLNLAMAVGTVLYDRQAKLTPQVTLEETLQEKRGKEWITI